MRDIYICSGDSGHPISFSETALLLVDSPEKALSRLVASRDTSPPTGADRTPHTHRNHDAIRAARTTGRPRRSCAGQDGSCSTPLVVVLVRVDFGGHCRIHDTCKVHARACLPSTVRNTCAYVLMCVRSDLTMIEMTETVPIAHK